MYTGVTSLSLVVQLVILVSQTASQQDFYCDQPVDIAILLDTSAFMGSENFAKQKSFVKNFVTYFQLSARGLGPHLAFVPYGDRVSESGVINFRYSSSVRRLAGTIDSRLKYTGRRQSRLDVALQYTENVLFQKDKGARAWVQRVVIVITGSLGYWNERERNVLTQYANRVRDDGIRLLFASIGHISDRNRRFLQSMVAERDDALMVRRVYGLTQVAEKMVRKSCPVPRTFACPAIVDLAFIVDSSGSISTTNYNQMKYFIYSISNALNMSATGTHAAVVLYSNIAEVPIKFNNYKDIVNFQEAVYNLHHIKSFTRIDLGLKAAYAQLFASPESGARADVKKVAFILTDGQQSSDENGVTASLADAARPLMQGGVRTISVGIGSHVNREELRAMVEKEGDVIVAANFDELTKRIQNISQFACEAVGPSVCDKAVDIAFILDTSGSINLVEFNDAKRFIEAIANKFVVSTRKTRVALMTYSYEARVISKFGTILSQGELRSRLRVLPHLRGKTRIDLAFRAAAADLFTARAGMRLTSSKVAIVITDGRQSPAADAIRLDEAAVPLLMRGVKVLAIGVGDKIDKYELNMMVSKRERHVFVAKSYGALRLKTAGIANEACKSV